MVLTNKYCTHSAWSFSLKQKKIKINIINKYKQTYYLFKHIYFCVFFMLSKTLYIYL